MKSNLQNTQGQYPGIARKLGIYPVLLAILLFQSCAVYQRAPVSLSEASLAQTRVKVINTSGDKISFRKIIAEDSLFYGMAGSKKIILSPAQINSIYLKDENSI